MAIENERLHAEVRAQLEEVRASRQRIVEAGDRAIRRPPDHPHQYASDGNDRGDCGQRPQTAGFPHSFNCDIRPQH